MIRSEFQFFVPKAKLIEATQACIDHHLERFAFWESELNKAESAFKEKGFTIEELPESAQFSTYRADANVSFDQDLKRRVETCKRHFREHKEKIEEYKRWLRAFEQDHKAERELDVDDLAYFNL